MALEADLTTVGAICGIAASVWLIVRDVAPWVIRTVPRIIRFVKRKHVEYQDTQARQRAELAEQTLQNEHRAEVETFEASVLRLLDMEQGTAEYHPTEWKRQVESCKRNTLRTLRQIGIRMDGGSVRNGPWIKNCSTGSIIVDWGPSKRSLGQVRLIVFWHPSQTLTYYDFHDSYFPDGTIEHLKVLSQRLTDADMALAGWEYFDGWRDSAD